MAQIDQTAAAAAAATAVDPGPLISDPQMASAPSSVNARNGQAPVELSFWPSQCL